MHHKDKRDLIDRDEAVFNPNFLDDISLDFPKGAWSLLKDTTETVAIVRSQLWPGYYAYHRARTPIFGGVYIGNGIKNLDIAFLI